MKITFLMIPGKVHELTLPEGTSVAEALWRLGVYDDDRLLVKLNGKYTFLDHKLADGDRIIAARSITGSAPVPPEKKENRIRILQGFTAGAEDLVIIDPYILHMPRCREVHDYVATVSDAVSLRYGNLKRLHLIGSRRDSQQVLVALEEACQHHKCTLVYNQTSDIHDRIWIKDDREALVVGTSLNSLGAVFRIPAADDR
jgi:hypothetical protein